MKITLGKLRSLALQAPLILQWDGGYADTPTVSCLSPRCPSGMTYR